MSTETSSGPTEWQQKRQEALAERGLAEVEQYSRASDLFYPDSIRPARRGRIENIISLGPTTGDTYIAELVEKFNGENRTWFAVVIDGKKDPQRMYTADAALLHYLSRKHNNPDASTAAWYAARVLGMPDLDQDPAAPAS
ncbi:hypothetical protein [Kitasatospora viridis]|uniref:Uncharacterized protein n=1 Tax=Kitasatospora viridis TaxID=281105 RepID=A0A561SA55_9ACTN|nr:hypothetical protein [Kitasatospora viridis]TWF71763.1 hypothetical protein FHX73_18134 [Kitasatospora viridis]